MNSLDHLTAAQRIAVERRFWAKVDKNGQIPKHCPGLGPCWLWRGWIRPGYGYGSLTVAGSHCGAHRMAYLLKYKSIPESGLILHRCDVRSCVNWSHLFPGTNLDNVLDKVTKGRQQRGESVVGCKLTNNLVRRIIRRLSQGECQKYLAREFRVCTHVVWDIHHNKTWKHIKRPDEFTPRHHLARKQKLTGGQVLEIRRLLKGGGAARVIASRFKISKQAVSQIKNNVYWKHIPS